MMHTSRNDKYPSLPVTDIVKEGTPSGVKLLLHCQKCSTDQRDAMWSFPDFPDRLLM
jgi:hypothetical protein